MLSPVECRVKAHRCVALATKAANFPEFAAVLIDLAQTWMQIAIQLERMEQLLDMDVERPS